MKKQLIGFVTFAFLCVAVAGCGNLETTSGSAPTKNVTIDIRSSTRFGANPLVITPGTSVTWVNDDSAEHTATSDNGAFASGALAPEGGTYSYTFEKQGTYPYHSAVTADERSGSESMAGRIVVRADDPGADGSDGTSTTVTPDDPLGPIPTVPTDCKQCQQQQKPTKTHSPNPIPSDGTNPSPFPTAFSRF